MGELVNAARTLGETGNFVDGFKRLVSNVLTNTKKLFRYTIHNGQIFEQVATNPPVMAALMMVRDIKPRNDGNEEHEKQDTGRVIRDIKNVYPEVIDLFRGVNDSISKHSITLDEENKLTDYIFVIIAELMKRINEKGIGDIINVSNVMMKRNFDSLFTEPKTEYSLYDVITELMKKINDNKSSGGRVELEVNDINEKLAEKADKDELEAMNKVLKSHKHNISDINELQATLDKKADKTYVNDELDLKVDKEYMASVLEKKVDKEYVDEKDNEIKEMVEWYHEWTSKILKTKADTGWISGCLDLKVDKTYVNDELDKKADKEHTHKSFTIVRADDIILNYTLGSSAPLENPSTSVKDTLNNLDNRCMNIEGHARNFEAYELPAMLDKKADKTELQTMKTEILQTLYPIGSIYTSMNSTNPETVLGFGAWEQIVDKFLYCANSSKQTGGSKKITEANLPPHTHTGTTNTTGSHSHSITKRGFTNLAAGSDRQGMHRYDISSDPVDSSAGIFCGTTGNHSHTFTTNPTGSGEDYMPPFVTIFAWYRTA
ncbi:keratin-associated protein family [Trichomonas vaginalis G3]|uniref:keratin-associated protein family n=1 Tax=Trichomonas vaginalis (strain ATCC PRA-98 / G3) TaxID=412133 RepID=UPI0021E53C7C|nr:keratin-associated protein family [Trichomonas vaginalis G3]KAI5532180.1 keratin-associated protein family [Trichomonas vaginalis G3]